MKKLLFSFFALAAISLQAQNFQISFAPSSPVFQPFDIVTCSTGGYVACGNRDNSSAAVVKTDASGNIVWSIDLTPSLVMNLPIATSIGELSGGGYYVLITDAYYQSFMWGNVPFVFVKLGTSGNVISSNLYTTAFQSYLYWDTHPNVKELSNGNFLFNMSLWDRMGIFCTDPSGGILWSKTCVNDTIKDPSTDVIVCSDGSVMTLGKRNYDMHLMKTDINGNLQWSKIFDDSGQSYTRGKDVIRTSDGNLVIAGLESDPTYYVNKGFIMKIDNSGNVLWFKTYSDTAQVPYTWFNKIIELPSGELVTSGTNNLSQLIFTKCDANGNLISSRSILGTSLLSYEDFQSLSISGNRIIFSDDQNFCMIATDLNLNFTCGSLNNILVQASPVYNPTIINGQVTVVSSGIASSSVTCTTTAFPLSIADWCTLFSVNDPVQDLNINVYPNPATTNSTISVDDKISLNSAYAELYDVMGRKISTIGFTGNKAEVDRNNIESGIYLYKIFNDGTLFGTGKIVFE